MFQIERLQRIKQILTVKKAISVIELSDILDVSEMTIRRDFEKLEKDGFLQRTHGGAVLFDELLKESIDETLPELKIKYTNLPITSIPSSSIELGKICAGIIEDYDIIFLGRCPSNIAITQMLDEKEDVIVVTNSIEIMLEMSRNKKNRVILLGGRVDFERWLLQKNGDSDSFAGIKVQKAFLRVQGIDFASGITFNDYEDLLTYNQLKDCTTGDIVIVAEGTLFGRTGLHCADSIDNITAIVTDAQIPDDYKNRLYRNGVKLYQKFNF